MTTKNADLVGLDQMHREWEAWRQVCKHLEHVGVDVNAAPELVAALRLWKENAELRRQGPEHLARALAERRAEYATHEIKDGKAMITEADIRREIERVAEATGQKPTWIWVTMLPSGKPDGWIWEFATKLSLRLSEEPTNGIGTSLAAAADMAIECIKTEKARRAGATS